MNSYDIGDLVQVTGTFRDENGALADPTTVQFKFKKPDGTITTWNVAVDQIVRLSLGIHYARLAITNFGRWYYRMIGTGNVQAVEKGVFYVKPDDF